MKTLGEHCAFFLNDLGKILDQVEAFTLDKKKLYLEEALEWCGKSFLQCRKENRKIIFIGNGGSAAIASHQALDYWKNGNIKAISFNEGTLLTCVANDFGYENVFSTSIEMFAEAHDVLVAISSSGESQNIIKAIDSARKMKCHVFSFSGFKATNLLRTKGDLNFYVPSMNYGIVEVAHLSLLHAILDSIMKENEKA